jgi:hypothetical protein
MSVEYQSYGDFFGGNPNVKQERQIVQRRTMS